MQWPVNQIMMMIMTQTTDIRELSIQTNAVVADLSNARSGKCENWGPELFCE